MAAPVPVQELVVGRELLETFKPEGKLKLNEVRGKLTLAFGLLIVMVNLESSPDQTEVGEKLTLVVGLLIVLTESVTLESVKLAID